MPSYTPYGAVSINNKIYAINIDSRIEILFTFGNRKFDRPSNEVRRVQREIDFPNCHFRFGTRQLEHRQWQRIATTAHQPNNQ